MKLGLRTEAKIDLLARLGDYLLNDSPQLQAVKQEAYQKNSWFIPLFIDTALKNIAEQYLQKDKLEDWLSGYPVNDHELPRDVGLVMAGNIPAVGFHDLLCIFLSGHKASVKLSSKDQVLISHLVKKLIDDAPELAGQFEFRDMLKGCDAYIATGSNNSARYFQYYFGKYPHLIRKNRTSLAVLDGGESTDELKSLGDDVFQYFGLGCRNVTKLLVPEDYDFAPLMDAFKNYSFLKDIHHYHNNFDYNLSLLLLNKVPYQTNDMVLLVENASPFSPISVLHYEKYRGTPPIAGEDIQCIVGHQYIPFGSAQRPALNDYADAMNTMEFLCLL